MFIRMHHWVVVCLSSPCIIAWKVVDIIVMMAKAADLVRGSARGRLVRGSARVTARGRVRA